VLNVLLITAFFALLLYFAKQTASLTNVHDDKHQNQTVKSKNIKSQTLSNHEKQIRLSQQVLKELSASFKQVRSRSCHRSWDSSTTSCCIPEHTAIIGVASNRPRHVDHELISVFGTRYTFACMTPKPCNPLD